MTPFSERADAAMAKLKADIEAFATEVRFSASALNDYNGQHTQIVNGAIKAEGKPACPWPGLKEACERSLALAQTLSAHHRGDEVALFWRVVPEWKMANYSDEEGDPVEQPSTYLRLSFAINGNEHGE